MPYPLTAVRGGGLLTVEEATTNLIANPSVETNTTGYVAQGGAIAQTTDQARFGDYSIEVTPTAGLFDGVQYFITLVPTTEYTLSVWVLGAVGIPYFLRFYDRTAPATISQTFFIGTGRWQRVTTTGTTGANTAHALQVQKNNNASTAVFYTDAYQLEELDHATSYCDGSLGPGYAWTGVAHASTSTRT